MLEKEDLMAQESRYINCGCGKSLRVVISNQDDGKLIEITCPNCREKHRAIIIGKQTIHDLIQKIGLFATKAIEESGEVSEAISALRRAGFQLDLLLAANIQPIEDVQQIIEQVEAEPKVEDGEIRSGTFTREDEEWLRKLANINLNR